MYSKKIIYTGAFRFPTGDAAAPRVLNNAKLLRALGYEVVFVSFGGKVQELDKGEDGNFYYQGFRYIISNDIDLPEPNIIKRIIRFIYSGRNAFGLINTMIEEVDVVIAYQPFPFFTNKVMQLCDSHNKKFITDITEWYAPDEFPGGVFAPPAWLNEWNMRMVQKRVKNKIVISSFLKDYYSQSNTILLPPLVDKNEEKWNDFKSVLPPFEGVRFIYAGTPGRKDLLETMLEAVMSCVKQKQKLQFIVVGVSKKDIAHYKNSNEILLFNEQIIFCGRVLQTEVPSYYKASDFSIIVRESNRKNRAGFPTKLAETMMAGCPVILNYTSDIDKFVQNGYNGFVMPNWSVNELKNILIKVVSLSKEEIDVLKYNALQSATEKFHYSSYIDKMAQFIQREA